MKKLSKLYFPIVAGLLGSGILVGCGTTPTAASGQPGTVVIGSKNFTESTIMAYVLGDLIKAKTHLHVKYDMNLGGTNITEGAIQSGKIDMYTEYTATVYEVYLHHTKHRSESQVYRLSKQQLQKQMGLTLTKPLGFNDGFTMVVTQQTAKKYHLTTDSQLAAASSHLTFGVDPEFRVRQPDGWPNLSQTYGMHPKSLLTLSNGVKYTALTSGKIQVTDGFTTDPQIDAYHLVPLTDNKHFFMLYDAVPIVRQATLKKYPQLTRVLNLLGGKISTAEMSHLNALVAIKHKSASVVAQQFLKKIGLIK